MYLHLGQNTVIKTSSIVGIFDIDNTTTSERTRKFLKESEKLGRVVYTSMEIPKSFIVTDSKTVYISQISCSTLLKRADGTEQENEKSISV